MAVRLYLGVEGVLLHRTVRAEGARRGFEMAPYALQFLSWAVTGFDCFWLTRLNRDGGDNRIRRAFQIAMNMPFLPSEFDMLFEIVSPTVWDTSMAEAIDFDRNFFWVANDPDEGSIKILQRRGLSERLMLCSTRLSPDDFATIQCKLGPLSDPVPILNQLHQLDCFTVSVVR